MADRRKNTFYIQGTILAAASVFSRIVGFVFGIFLSRILDDDGLGVYQNAYEVYSLALILSTNSIPIAVSKLVSERESKKQFVNSYRLFRLSFVVSSVIGFVTAVLIFIFAEQISVFVYQSPDTAIPLRVLSPTIFVFAMLGSVRGFFQGKNTAIPTSISQVLEQIAHVVCGLVFANIILIRMAEKTNVTAYAAAGATGGTFVGAVIALLFLGFIYLIYKPVLYKRLKKDYSGSFEEYGLLFKILMLTVLPIILHQLLYNVTSILGLSFMNRILSRKGFDEAARKILSANYSGRFVKLTNVPIAIASGMGIAIVPSIAKAKSAGSLREIHSGTGQAVKFSMMISIPCAFGLISLAEPLMRLFTDDQDSVSMASKLMYIGGFSVVLYAYATISNSILQGIGNFTAPVISAVIGIIAFTLVQLGLLVFTDLGVYSMPIGYMTFAFVVSVINFFVLKKETHYFQEFLRTFLLPAAFSAIMAVVCFFSYEGVYYLVRKNVIALFGAVFFGIFTYGLLMAATRTLSEEEIVDLPMGARLLRALKKVGLYHD